MVTNSDFGNWKKLNASCVLSPKNMQELDGIAKNNDIVLFLHSHSCGHCKKTIPILEEECKNNDTPLKFIECPIEQPHCREVAQAAKVTGVPFIVGVSQGKSILNHDWKVVGARIPELRGNIQGSKEKALKSPGGPSGSPSAGPRMPARPPPQPHAPRVSMDNAFLQLMGSTPSVPYSGPMQFQAPNPKYVELCVPGKTCSQDEFEQKFVDFYSNDI
jgi:thiol-disulfide isomerase/thioredoxin